MEPTGLAVAEVAVAAAADSRPFRQGAYSELPERPRRPHPYFDLASETLSMDSASFGGIDVHYRCHGSGPPLLLVHGLMTSSYSWRYVFEPLGAHYRCIAPDLPGAGRSSKPDRPYTPQAFARWLSELVDVLDIRGCRVVGNSMGGYLCMQWALADPSAMSRLVNLHSPGIPEARLFALHTVMAVPGAWSLLRALVHRDPLRWAHRNVHYYDESLKSVEEAREYGEPLASREGVASFARFLGQTMSPWAMRDFVAALASRRDRGEDFVVPLQLLYAAEDPMVPPRVGDELRALVPGASFARLQEASHFAHVDATERFVDAVLPFLTAAG